MKKDMTLFGLVRHSRTEWNREKRIQGQKDSPLTPEGVFAAISRARLLAGCGWSRILHSDLGRAKMTASLMNLVLQLPASSDRRLREQDWGEWVGERIDRIEKDYPELLKEFEGDGWPFAAPGGENRNQVFVRAKEALAEASRRWPGERILVITHEGVIKCITYRLLNRRFLPEEKRILCPHHLHTVESDGYKLLNPRVNAAFLGP